MLASERLAITIDPANSREGCTTVLSSSLRLGHGLKQMLSYISLVISLASLAAAVYALWVGHIRRGQLRMTQPAMLFIGRDKGPNTPKFWLRTLLFSTSAKGQIIETMFLRIHSPVSGPYTFDFWAYNEGDQITRGSGLFVEQTGIACNNHFMLRQPNSDFLFWPGDYRIEIYASILGRTQPIQLMQIHISIDHDQASQMTQLMDAGIFFDWDPEKRTYSGHIESKTAKTLDTWKRLAEVGLVA